MFQKPFLHEFVGMVSVGAHAHGRRNNDQKTGGWKDASLHREVMWESLPRPDKCWRLMVLLKPQELINSGYKKSAESVWSQQHTPKSTMVFNSHHIQEGGGCYMQTKTTALNRHLVKQGTLRALVSPLVCQYEPPCLRNQLGSASQLLLQAGNWEHVCTLKGVIECTPWWLSGLHNNSWIPFRITA